MNAYLRSRRSTLKFLLLALLISLLLAACERPLQTVIQDDEPTPTTLPVDPTAAPEEATPRTDEDPVEEATPPIVATMPADDPTAEAPSDEAEPTATPVSEDESPRGGDEGEAEEGEDTGDATETPTKEATSVPEEEATPEPTAEPTAAPSSEDGGSDQERIHTVQSGENLYRIGLQYGISWTVLAEHNGIANPNSLIVGQQIRIPPTTSGEGGAATPAPQVTHVVQPGETLFIISQQYGVVWTDIAAANNLVAPYTIHAGQTLVIPGG